ncbi:SMR family transporter [Microvirga ossetica]|uniref:SMR family transporter n=1 Tax=Microvirga ossetica TaxID=1882682 RepID=UPI00130008FC|nr:SMR family transporter [Microvirga ossetica]
MRYLFLLGTIALLAAGQVLFKLSAGRATLNKWDFLLSPPFIIALFTYGVATLLWVFTLKVWPLTIAYAAQAITIVIVITIGVVVFKESLSTVQYLGVGVIIFGLAILASG